MSRLFSGRSPLFFCNPHLKIMSKAERLETLLSPVVDKAGFEIVDLQYLSEGGRWVLRIFIDASEGHPGVTLDDCQRVSGAVSDAMDKDFAGELTGAYCLEISSPGIQRALKKEKDFKRFTGKRAEITLYAPVDSQRRFVGEIAGFENGSVKLKFGDGATAVFPLKSIARARLEPEM